MPPLAQVCVLADGVVHLDAQGRVVRASSRKRLEWLVSDEDIRGRTIRETHPPDLADIWDVAIEQAHALGESVPVTYEWRGAGGWHIRTALVVPQADHGTTIYITHRGTRLA